MATELPIGTVMHWRYAQDCEVYVSVGSGITLRAARDVALIALRSEELTDWHASTNWHHASMCPFKW